MPDQALHRLIEYSTVIPLITTDLVSSHSKHLESSSESMQSGFLSPFTVAATTATKAFEEEGLIIPVVEVERRSTQDDKVIKQGLVLCTRTAQWYTKRKSTTGELQLRKTRLRWRQFKAVLKPDKIELYHVTTTFLRTQRIAHVIYLDNKYPYKRVRLSIVSTQDCIWCLQFVHYQTKSIISFHFQSTNLSDAQDWYMTLYYALPASPACKNPIPAFVDIQVMIDSPIQIRLPLDYILLNTKNTLLNIHIQDIKPVIRSLLQKDDLLRTAEWIYHDFRLCWRPVNALFKQETTVVTSGNEIEWLTENVELIGPQLIEQKHVLELHTSQEPTEKSKLQRRIITFDGLLISKSWAKSNTQQKIKCKKSHFYVVLYGNHLFFFDGLFYYYYKRQAQRQENQRRRNEQSEQKKQHNWFSATTGLLLQQRRLSISKENKKHIYEQGNKSSPHFKYSTSSIDLNVWPDPTKLVNAHLVLDLHKVTRVQPMLQKGTQHATSNTFAIHINNEILYYEAPNTQSMLQWVSLVNNAIKMDYLWINSSLAYRHHRKYDGNKSILQSGFLYVKQNFKKTFQPQYCILSKSENYDGLIMFDTLQGNPQHHSTLFNCMRPSRNSERMQQRKEMILYQKKRVLLHLKDAYVYSGDECISDKYEREKVEPSRFYKDGTITGGNKTSDCIFVIWQLATRRFVPNVREYMSLFKLGHRLGNRGSCWVFKARSKQERDAWLETLHVEFGLLSKKYQ
ncbi:hypothetical protein [Parasitella parasitica]|uniref:PH domain-containing protein n=1 Tax=Parasitella parasitica TaxID=35722 RepID=A0A0B7NQ42_9FUNG|nr:hypothetical protein [Parasitella parasitica]